MKTSFIRQTGNGFLQNQTVRIRGENENDPFTGRFCSSKPTHASVISLK